MYLEKKKRSPGKGIKYYSPAFTLHTCMNISFLMKGSNDSMQMKPSCSGYSNCSPS